MQQQIHKVNSFKWLEIKSFIATYCTSSSVIPGLFSFNSSGPVDGLQQQEACSSLMSSHVAPNKLK